MSKKAHNYYETTFIVDSIFEDDRIDSIINKYSNFVKKNEGEVVKVEKWGRKKLAYPIKKKVTGFYISIEFTADPSVIAKLERAYHLDEDIIRFLTVTFDKKTLVERNIYLVKKEQIMKEREAAAQLLLHPAEAEKIPETDKVAEADQVVAEAVQVTEADTVAEAKIT